jgi:hypothetical protein
MPMAGLMCLKKDKTSGVGNHFSMDIPHFSVTFVPDYVFRDVCIANSSGK